MRLRTRILALPALLLAGTAQSEPLCAGPVAEDRAREIAIEFIAALPFAQRYRSSPEHVSSLENEYRFLFPRVGDLDPGERIMSSSSAQILVNKRTGCARHQLW